MSTESQRRKNRKAMRTLDHAIDHLGPTKHCGLLVTDSKIAGFLPNTSSNADAARAVLCKAMLKVVKELR